MSIIQNIQSMFQVGACKKIKSIKNMNDNISLVIKGPKQDIMVYIKLQKSMMKKYEWQHFVSYQKTNTGYTSNGLYQNF